MEKENVENNSKLVVAIVLIVLGLFWFLGQLNIHLHFESIFHPFFNIFSRLGRVIFSWPMILVFVGLLLVAGKRQGGWILVVLGGFFLLPKIFVIPGFTFSMIFPVVLILAGIIMLVRKV
jgi:predicted membrane protein